MVGFTRCRVPIEVTGRGVFLRAIQPAPTVLSDHIRAAQQQDAAVIGRFSVQHGFDESVFSGAGDGGHISLACAQKMALCIQYRLANGNAVLGHHAIPMAIGSQIQLGALNWRGVVAHGQRGV